ncbi:MAG TPA: cell division protein SepF [Thermoleophilia bacterium]
MGLAQSLRAVVDQLNGAGDDYDDYDDDDETYRDESTHGSPQARERDARPLAVVRPSRVEFALVAPQDFEAAQQIADRLRAGEPVFVDLQACGADLSERLIDFCSGLTYALEGRLDFIGAKVLLLAPRHVELSSEALGGLRERRFLNQF